MIRSWVLSVLAAVWLGISNSRHEGTNGRVRLIINCANGFHSATAVVALIIVTAGPIEHVLARERTTATDS
jgi:transposase